MSTVRLPAVAGDFYAAGRAELAALTDALLEGAAAAEGQGSRLILAPHAAHMYSGKVAATAYRQLPGRTRRVVVIGPAHAVPVEDIALAGAAAHRTPLGDIPVDADLARLFLSLPGVVNAPAAHEGEHSVEVHLPFLQRLFPQELRIVPVLCGGASPALVAEIISRALEPDRTAVIISSDLSHGLKREAARKKDSQTLSRILSNQLLRTPLDACGYSPVNGAVRYAKDLGLAPRLLCRADSSRTSKDLDRVVGYASLAWFYPAPGREDMPSSSACNGQGGGADQRETVIQIAADAISDKLAVGSRSQRWTAVGDDLSEVDLQARGASFVTVKSAGQLRGCMGTLEPRQHFQDDIAENAVSAAFADPRFPPLTEEEFLHADLEVALLMKPVRLGGSGQRLTRKQVSERLRPHQDGAVVVLGDKVATFLPQVWAQISDPDVFLAALLQKAGLDPRAWNENTQIFTYEVKTVQGRRRVLDDNS